MVSLIASSAPADPKDSQDSGYVLVVDGGKTPHSKFREYSTAADLVRRTYALNHTHQTVAYVKSQLEKYKTPQYGMLGIWEALQLMSTVVDESDPDTSLPQIMHALQSAEACRRDGQPEWMIVTALIHDLGKVLSLMGEPQWAVVGDTFPVGCPHADSIVYHEEFVNNPDTLNPLYSSLRAGMYEEGCGLDNLIMSFGHDEYLYRVVRAYLPVEAAYVIRYHSFYPYHKHGSYMHFQSDFDREMMKYLEAFNQYDLYSKHDDVIVDVEELRPYYEELLMKFFPAQIQF